MPKPKITALIDADYLVYAAGFAAQHTNYVALSCDEEGDITTEDVILERFDDKTAYNAWIKQPDVEDDDKVERPRHTLYEQTTVEPPENACHSCKLQLQRMIERVEKKFERPVEAKLFLTGTGNFRELLATIKPYKGNRPPWHKPRLQRELRAYMQDAWGAEVIHHQEADDEVAIRQYEQKCGDDTIICGLDKDLHMVPGWHYSATKDAFARITPKQAKLIFWRQVISGDSVDNIMGVYRVGAKAAKDIISPKMTNKQCWEAVLATFAENMEKYPDKYPYEMTPEEAALETARLIWMRRKRNELWTPPK